MDRDGPLPVFRRVPQVADRATNHLFGRCTAPPDVGDVQRGIMRVRLGPLAKGRVANSAQHLGRKDELQRLRTQRPTACRGVPHRAAVAFLDSLVPNVHRENERAATTFPMVTRPRGLEAEVAGLTQRSLVMVVQLCSHPPV